MSKIQITLPVSQHTITINRLRSDMMVQANVAAEEELMDKKPQPPLQKVVMADGKEEEMPNEGHPDYVKQLSSWKSAVNTLASTKVLKIMVKLGIVDNPPDDIVDIYEQYKELGISAAEDLKMFWVTSIVAPAADDVAMLMFEIFGRTMAREVQVEFYRSMFRGHVPGKVDLEVAHTEGERAV